MPDYQATWFHKLIASKLETFLKDDIKHLIINLPPRHGTTELCVRKFIPYAIDTQSPIRINFRSYNRCLTDSIMRDLFRHYVSRYKYTFGLPNCVITEGVGSPTNILFRNGSNISDDISIETDADIYIYDSIESRKVSLDYIYEPVKCNTILESAK